MSETSAPSTLRVAVAGNPNVGKTSLFNVLTGSRHRVGNYSGVTVQRLEGEVVGKLAGEGPPIRLVDLPGIYSLSPTSEDEVVAFDVLTAKDAPDAVLLVLDASNLARNLYLALQVLELGLPLVVALNMVDMAREAGLPVQPQRLAKELGVPVVPTVARTGEGVQALVDALRALDRAESHAPVLVPPGPDDTALQRALEGLHPSLLPAEARTALLARRAGKGVPGAAGTFLASLPESDVRAAAQQLVCARYRRVDEILEVLGHRERVRDDAPAMAPSQRIDAVLTHRVAGLAIFIAVMAFIFVSIFSWADPIMGLIEDAFGWLSGLVSDALGPGLLTELVTEGVIAGVGNVVVFVPQIALLFLFLGLLEDSGYLARAAFLLDRLMARMGLHGRAFIPLLSGYACAIPAILGTRTISTTRDRLVTILMIPFMSCSARLPIYTLVIGALFVSTEPVISRGVDQGLVLLSMYLLSTVSALAMGFLYKRTILVSPTPPLVLELPPYRLPRVRDTLLMVYDRVKDFLRGAATVIMACTVVLWALLSFPAERTGAGQGGATMVAQSYGGRMARTLEPALQPIGQDWRVGVGIIGSFAAREVLVSTLGLVYGMETDEDDPVQLRQALREQKDPDTGRPQHTPLSGFALMVFFVYACMCMSTLAVVRRETGGWKWPAFMFVSMTGLAYVMALLVFQGGRALGLG
ncbi:ferrous iron transport protein B [Paraliomyxa miuraensis]|uniref:ferrous iron transport protein B n=1 Tax=Paraliomyxa miuraensis TaxID=376150 RepID=UPI00224D98C3|nr:ferrous iron transport protein B [Paraliomyxa miuraensis]MCX4241160.1 ferrous iron transport protein B [Paraliomyxa miuraensis]